MKLQIALVLFGLCSTSSALELKGMPLGTPMSEVQKQLPEQKCDEEILGYMQCTVAGQTYAGVQPTRFGLVYVNKALEGYSVRLPGKLVEEMKASIEAKIGPANPLRDYERPNPLKADYGNRPQVWNWTQPNIAHLELRFFGSESLAQRADWQTNLFVMSDKASEASKLYSAEKKRRSTNVVKSDM